MLHNLHLTAFTRCSQQRLTMVHALQSTSLSARISTRISTGICTTSTGISPRISPRISPQTCNSIRIHPIQSMQIIKRPLTATTKTHASQAHSRVYAARTESILTAAFYTAGTIILFVGLSFAAVPFYKIICTQTGLDGTPVTSSTSHRSDPEQMRPVPGAKRIRILFTSSTSDAMRWKFVPQTREIYVVPGETALAFYTAENPTEEPVTGISTYSVVPAKAAQYFNKIQCFCFEEQRLLPKEEIDMPVFFYMDPEFANDPWMRDVDTITLGYTFFKAKEGKVYANMPVQ